MTPVIPITKHSIISKATKLVQQTSPHGNYSSPSKARTVRTGPGSIYKFIPPKSASFARNMTLVILIAWGGRNDIWVDHTWRGGDAKRDSPAAAAGEPDR